MVERCLDTAEVGGSIPPGPTMEIAYEDKDFLVVEKPPFLSTEELIEQVKKEHPAGEGVHRLDTNTSGLLIIALNSEAKKYFQDQFKKGLVEKKYIALVKNHLVKKEGIINYPMVKIGAKHISLTAPRKQFEGKKTREAVTEYKVLKNNDDFALLEVMPKTGRTHQIRSHLSAINHYIIGDYRYGPKNQPLQTQRYFLHAYHLKFTTPEGREISLESKLPEDLLKILKTVKLSI